MQKFTIQFLFLLALLGTSQSHGQQVDTYITIPGVRLEAITWAPSGYFYSLDYWTGRVYKIGPGSTVQTLVTGMNGPIGGTMDKDGNFYFSESGTGKIYKVKPDDNYHEFASGFFAAAGMVPDPTGDSLYVVNYGNSSVVKLALADSSQHAFVSGGGLNGPDGIVLAPNNDLIVANFDDNKIHRITPAGNTTLFSTLTTSPNSGYIARIGQNYYSTGFNGHQIWKLDSVGNAAVFAGTGTLGYQDGPASTAQFHRPNGIVVKLGGDTLFITEGNVGGHLRIITDLDFVTAVERPNAAGFDLDVTPNPAGNQSIVSFQMDGPGKVEIAVFDLEGRLLKVLWEGEMEAGEQKVELGPTVDTLSAGTYVCRLHIDSVVISKRFIIVE